MPPPEVCSFQLPKTCSFRLPLTAALVTADAVHELEMTPGRQRPGKPYRQPPEEGTDHGSPKKRSGCPECSARLKLDLKRLVEPYSTED